MITISTRTNDLNNNIQSCINIINEKNTELMRLYDELSQPMIWFDNSQYRIILSSNDISSLVVNYKPLIDYVFSSDMPIVNDSNVFYVYCNYILTEHFQLLSSLNIKIETNENYIAPIIE